MRAGTFVRSGLMLFIIPSLICACQSGTSGDNNAQIVSALQRIQAEGGESNFVVFLLDEGKNYYIQFSGARDKAELYAEAVSNAFIAQDAQLSPDAKARLNRLGWISPVQSGSPNYSQTWLAENDAQRKTIADLVIETFETIYGMQPGDHLQVNLVLE